MSGGVLTWGGGCAARDSKADWCIVIVAQLHSLTGSARTALGVSGYICTLLFFDDPCNKVF